MVKTREPTSSELWQARRRHPGIWIAAVVMIGLWFNDSVPGKAELTDFQLGLAVAGAFALLIYCWRDAEREARRTVAMLAEFETGNGAKHITPSGADC